MPITPPRSLSAPNLNRYQASSVGSSSASNSSGFSSYLRTLDRLRDDAIRLTLRPLQIEGTARNNISQSGSPDFNYQSPLIISSDPVTGSNLPPPFMLTDSPEQQGTPETDLDSPYPSDATSRGENNDLILEIISIKRTTSLPVTSKERNIFRS